MIDLRDAKVIVAVDMSVDKIRGLVFLKQGVKAFKSPVRKVFKIVKSPRGCVGQKDVKTAVPS